MNLLATLAPECVVLRDREHSMTGMELQGRCATIAKVLIGLQVPMVALLADNSMDWICVDLACQQAQVCLVPLPTFFSNQQIRHVLDSCGIRAIFTDRPALVSALTGDSFSFSACAGAGALQFAVLPKATASAAVPADTGKITFTSGSTGQPKGVCLGTAHLLGQALRLRDAVAVDQPRHLCLLPLSTLLENVAGVCAPLLASGQVLVPRPQELGFSGSTLEQPQLLLARITELQPDTLILIPQLLSLLVAATAQGWRAPVSLKFVAVGGARVSAQAILAARAAGIPVYEGYGLSECASVVSLNTPAVDKPGSCGQPLSGLAVTLRDGELIVTGSAMLGYVNEPESWQPAQIATGDIGFQDKNGFIHISGRKKNLLISSYGRNISPEWLESELLANPLIAEAIVVGDALPFCSALLSVRRADIANAAVQRWIDQVNARLPDYACIRRWLRLTAPLSTDPSFMTDNGRPRREHIRKAFQDEIQLMYAETPAMETANTLARITNAEGVSNAVL